MKECGSVSIDNEELLLFSEQAEENESGSNIETGLGRREDGCSLIDPGPQTLLETNFKSDSGKYMDTVQIGSASRGTTFGNFCLKA